MLRKLMCTTNVNVVRGRSYENFYILKFLIRKFVNMKISRCTVHTVLLHVYVCRFGIDCGK